MILVVDDDPTVRAVLRAILVRGGYAVHTAAHAAEAIEVFQKHPFSLVLSDLSMPELDGFGLMSALRALPGGDLPIVALSGAAEAHGLGRVEGFDGVWPKPVAPARLLADVRQILSVSRAELARAKEPSR